MTRRIHPFAICVSHHAGRILVRESQDPIERGIILRPLGDGIEFGETSARAVEREVREEIGAGVARVCLFGTIENA
jgi:NADH pyrophosphatase NudC (nudix superfamily)